MKTKIRQRKILEQLEMSGSVSVTGLAVMLDVSENTIRNDLDTLADEGLLTRTHGGAALSTEKIPPGLRPAGALLTPHSTPIIQYALSWVNDGDTLILSDDPLCFLLAEAMLCCRHLRVVTPSLAIAYILAQEPTNRIVITGGEFTFNTLSTSGAMVESAIRNFRGDKAFISVSGLTAQNGLTEGTSETAQIKSSIRNSADSLFILVDSDRVGKADLFSTGKLSDARRIITDTRLDPSEAQILATAGGRITICWEGGHQTYRSVLAAGRHVRIGFANLSHKVWFSRIVLDGLQAAVSKVEGLELLVADNQTNAERALQNAQDLLSKDIDLLVEYEGTGEATRPIRMLAREADVPMIAIDIPILGATHIGSEHDAAGMTVGHVLGAWVKENWSGQADKVLWVNSVGGATVEEFEPVSFRYGDWNRDLNLIESISPMSRFSSAIETLQPYLLAKPKAQQLLLPGGWRSSEDAVRLHKEQISMFLATMQETDRVIVLSLVCESALGFAQAVREAGRNHQFILVAFGDTSPAVREELVRLDTCFLGVVDLHPELYGECIISTATGLLKGEAVPPAVFVKHSFLSAKEVQQDVLHAVYQS
jgi:DeoR family transcriptional regulator, fructose operon transcriptional repressor